VIFGADEWHGWVPAEVPTGRYDGCQLGAAMADDIVIRRCRVEDVPKVEPLFLDLYGGRAPAAEDERLEQRLGEFFLVAERKGRIVGFAIGAAGPVDVIGREMARGSFPGQDTYLEVQDLYVAPAFRNQGIGSRLMRAVLDAGIAHGLRHSMVYTSNADYARAGRFYERFGYRIDHLFMKRSV
jgi:ribosomal protein S18 acetylase RimI-like enzyme